MRILHYYLSNASVRYTVIFHKSPLAADAYTPSKHKSSQSVPRAAVISVYNNNIYYNAIIETIPTDGRTSRCYDDEATTISFLLFSDVWGIYARRCVHNNVYRLYITNA